MKKLSSMAALGLALALTFGMTVSAAESATTAGVAPEIKEEQVKEYEDKSAALTEAVGSVTATLPNGQSVTVTKEPVKPATLFEAEQIATDLAKEKAADLNITVSDNQKIETKVVGSADIKLPEGTVIPEEGIQLDISISGITAGKTYVLLHLTTKDGKPVWETIVPDSVVDGKVTATFKSFSPVIANEVTLVEVGEEDTQDEWLEPRHPEQAQSAPAPGTSPKTAETLPVAGVMALICLAGAAVCAGRIRYNK